MTDVAGVARDAEIVGRQSQSATRKMLHEGVQPAPEHPLPLMFDDYIEMSVDFACDALKAQRSCQVSDGIKRLASRLGIDADWLQALIVDYSSSSGMSCEEAVRMLEQVEPAVNDRVPFDPESLRKAVNEMETLIAKHGCVDTKREKRVQIVNAAGRPRRNGRCPNHPEVKFKNCPCSREKRQTHVVIHDQRVAYR